MRCRVAFKPLLLIASPPSPASTAQHPCRARPAHLAALAAVLAALACGQAGSRSTAPGAAPLALRGGASAQVITPLPLPADAGNGPQVKAVCCNANNFGGADPLTQASALVNGYTALQVPAAPPTSFSVGSWPLGVAVDLSGGGSADGLFTQNLDPGKIFGGEKNNWAGLFSGYLRVDPSSDGQPQEKTFVIASDDGFRFAVSDGSAVQSMYCNTANRSMSTTFFGTVYYAGCPTPFGQSSLTVTFPAAGGLFPFDLLYFNGTGSQGIEWSWANGKPALPTASSLNGFALVPADHLYAPAVQASLTVSDANSPVQPGDTLTYSVNITNTGNAPLSTYTFSVKVDSTQLTTLVPDMGVTCSNSAGLLVCPLSQVLNPGSSVSGTFTAVVHAGLAANTIIDVQGVVTGLATAPEVANAVGGAGEQTAGEIYALTDDPYVVPGSNFETVDTGNTPAALASSVAVGDADDDATRVVVGTAVEAPPVITGPANPCWADVTQSISGTSHAPAGVTVEVSYTGPTPGSPVESCTATTGADGSWRCAASAFADGSYSARARLVDAGGNAGAWSAAYPFVVNAPFAPVIITPSSGEAVHSSLVVFSGTAQQVANGETVRVTVAPASGSPLICNATTLSDAWSCNLSLPDGAYSVTAAVLETTGGPGNVGGPVAFTVVTGGACGSTLQQTASPSNNSRPTFQGTAGAGDSLQVCSGGASPCGAGSTVLCSVATVPNSGAWSCQPASTLADGSYTAVAVATGNNASICPSNNDVFVIDTTAPAPPGFNPPASPTALATPVFSGTGIPGDQVQVGDGSGGAFGNLLCSATVAQDGSWSCTSSALADGSYSLQAVQVDLASNRSGPAVQPLVVDSAQPDAPTLAGPASPTNNPKLAFTGQSDLNTTVLVHDGLGNLLCQTSSVVAQSQGAARGNWSCTTATLADASYTVTAVAQSGAGVLSLPSAALTIVVDTTPPNPPVLDAVPSPTAQHLPLFSGSAEAGALVAVFEGSTQLCSGPSAGRFSCTSQVSMPNGPHTVTANATDAAGNVSQMSAGVSFIIDDTSSPAPTLDPIATPPGGQPGFTAQTEPTFTGTGVPGDTVSARLVGGATLCTAAVGGDGNWSCVSSTELIGVPPTLYNVEAVQQSPGGTHPVSLPSAPISFTVDTHVPVTPELDPPATPTTDHSPTFTGSAEALDLVEVDDATQGTLCTASADAQGNFSCSPAAPLADGDYLLTARSSSRSGVASLDSTPARPLTINTQPTGLAAPTLNAPASPTNHAQPTFTGTTTAGSQVLVISNGQTVCSGLNLNGSWSCQPASPLPDGTYLLTARATDDAGDVSPDSAAVTLVVDTTAPAVPIITAPTADQTLEDPAVTATGTAQVGTRVTISVDGTNVAALPTAADGTWTTPLGTLSGGSHTLIAKATDEAGNVSPPASVDFNIQLLGTVRGGCASGGLPAPLFALAALLFVWPRRRARGLRRSSPALKRALASLAALLLVAPTARAQQLDLGTLQPASDGNGLIGVQGARAPIDGDPRLAVNLWLDGAYEPLVFHPNIGGREVLVIDRIESFVGVQLHIWNRFSLAAQLPILLSESGDLSALPMAARPASGLGTALGDIRVTPRVSILRQETSPLDLAGELSITIPTAGHAAYAGDSRWQLQALGSVGRHILLGGVAFEALANLLVRLRTPESILDVKLGNEVGARGGIAWLPQDTSPSVPRRVFLEAEGESALRGAFAPGSIPAEWRLGASFCATRAISFDMAFGTALSSGVGSPRARLVLGLAFAPEACNDAARSRFAPRAPPVSFVAYTPPAKRPAAPASAPAPQPSTPAAPSAGASAPAASPAAPTAAASPNGLAKAPATGPANPSGAAPFVAAPPAAPAGKPAPLPPPGSNALALPDLDALPLAALPAAGAAAAHTPATAAPNAGEEPLPLAPLVSLDSAPAAPALKVTADDRDGDGVNDAVDSCPDTAGSAKNHGCPDDTKMHVALSVKKLAVDSRIEFKADSAELDKRSVVLVEQVAAVLSSHPEIAHVNVRVHIGSGMPDPQARALTQERADAVAKLLAAHGVGASRVSAEGVGASEPVAPNLSAQGRRKNERVEFVLGK